MPSFNVEIKNLAELQAKIAQFPNIAEKHMQTAINATAAEVMKNATRSTVPWKTGNLVQSFGMVMGRLYASIGPNRATAAGYAIYVHEGTRPHKILPKTAKALFWVGARHPVKSVNHPGTKPNRFMPRILTAAQSNIDAIWRTTLDRITKELASK